VPLELVDYIRERQGMRAPRNGDSAPAREPDAPIHEGERHDWLVSRAGKLVNAGLRGEALLAALLELSRTRCAPPLPDDEVSRIASDATERWDTHESRPFRIGAPPAPSEPRTLAEVEATFAKWIRDGDPIPTRGVLAAYAANRKLDGDPVWLMLVGGSGVGKTERLTPLAVMPDVVLESSITGPAALLSGTERKARAKNATGGLLRKLPEGGGILVLKDFTSVIDMHRESRAEVLAAMRELYDGRWDRSVGAEGGRTLTWEGHLGVLAGCTTVIDSAYAVTSVMGTRFLMMRLTGDPDIAGSALEHVGQEVAMREELRESVRGLLEHLPGEPHLVQTVREPLIALANYVALARSPVDRDSQSEIRLVLDAEAPTRVVKMLAQLWRACGLLGLSEPLSWDVVIRVGLDSVPKLRRVVLTYLAGCDGTADTTTIAEHVEHPSRTTRRALEDLVAHRVVLRIAGGKGKADLWTLAERTRVWLSQMTLPGMSEGTLATLPGSSGIQHAFSNLSNNNKIKTDDITGKVTLSADRCSCSCHRGALPAIGCAYCHPCAGADIA
jgi:hypothetical protein